MKFRMIKIKGTLTWIALASLMMLMPAGSRAVGGTARPQKPSKPLPDIRLVVTVHNLDESGQTMGIQNDNQGDYVDGENNVQAWVVGSTGLFYFIPNSPYAGAVAYPGMRSISIDFSKRYEYPTGVAYANPPSLANVASFWLNDDNEKGIQVLDVGQSMCGPSFRVLFQDQTQNMGYFLSYQYGGDFSTASPTIYSVITRTADIVDAGGQTKRQWIVRDSNCVDCCSFRYRDPHVAHLTGGTLKGKYTSMDFGYFQIPFYFTLTEK